jgi:nitroimidazol reductase NimA-like FMN-containing flavoprotein (pyridoxamine 5'-phosphate oxidase superfamily)
MDADTRLHGLEVLTLEECLELLARGCIGRVGFSSGGQPRVLPVNYAVDLDGTVVFRTTPESSLRAVAGHPAAFEVDGFDTRYKTGWSVCVHGLGRELSGDDDAMVARLRQLSVLTWAPGRRDVWLAVLPDEITGRRLPLAASPADFGWIAGVVS